MNRPSPRRPPQQVLQVHFREGDSSDQQSRHQRPTIITNWYCASAHQMTNHNDNLII